MLRGQSETAIQSIRDTIVHSGEEAANWEARAKSAKKADSKSIAALACLHYYANIAHDETAIHLLSQIIETGCLAITIAVRVDEMRSKIPALQNIDSMQVEVENTLRGLKETAQKIKDESEKRKKQEESQPSPPREGLYK